MAIDYEKIKNWPIADAEQTYTEKDAILYAMGLGLGTDPTDPKQLKFLYENAEDFQVLPTMAIVLATPGFWAQNPETGITWKTILHGEQGLTLHQPLPRAGAVIGKTRVTEILDKGEGRGALILTERSLWDKSSGAHLATLNGTSFARSDGGFGGPRGPQPAPHTLPERTPDAFIDVPTLPGAALLYRLSGDYNPLHADPQVAKTAKFERPILHGLCTMGLAVHALLQQYCESDAERLESVRVRFSSPVLPGQTIRVESWREHQNTNIVSFRARITQTDAIVINNGKLTLKTTEPE
jgi:acyl dehydratase